MNIGISICEPPKADLDKKIRNELLSFNSKYTAGTPGNFSVYATEENGELLGGVTVYTHACSIYIDILWVAESHRSKGLGKKILEAAESEGLKQGIEWSTLDTFDFQAEGFYRKNGYEVIGRIPQYVEGHDRIFLRKKLIAG